MNPCIMRMQLYYSPHYCALLQTVSTVEKSIAAVSATRSAERLAAKKKSKQLAMAGIH